MSKRGDRVTKQRRIRRILKATQSFMNVSGRLLMRSGWGEGANRRDVTEKGVDSLRDSI